MPSTKKSQEPADAPLLSLSPPARRRRRRQQQSGSLRIAHGERNPGLEIQSRHEHQHVRTSHLHTQDKGIVCVRAHVWCAPGLPAQGLEHPRSGMIPVGREVRDGTQDRTPDWEASGPKFQHDIVVVGPSRVESLSSSERADGCGWRARRGK